MAKKYRVKYAFGTPEIYAELKRTNKLDEYTVYFIAEENSNYGTFYRGEIEVGTSKASDLVFDKHVSIVLARASEPGDEDLTIEIEAGTSLVAVINDVYTHIFNSVDGVQEQINTLTGNGELVGSVADAIANAFLERFEDGTLYTQAECDEKFLTHDDLGSIEALIDVFRDPETHAIRQDVINTIVQAAEGIQAVVSNYYTKQEMDEKLVSAQDNIIKTYDSSANFPAAQNASKNVFYVDDEENTVYRWGLKEDAETDDDREYVEISGSGSSGPGGDVKLETKIYVKGGKTTVSVAKGNNLIVDFVFSSANTMTQYNRKTKEFEKIQQQTGTTASVKYYLDGIQFDSGSIRQSNYHEDNESLNTYNRIVVPAGRMNATKHTLKITAEDIAGNSCDELININIISATITSSYVPTPLSLDKDLEIPVTVTSTTDAELFYIIDGGDTVKVQDVPVGSPVIKIQISPMIDNGVRREHGYHNVKIWATTYIEESDTTISTAILNYDVIWYDSENETPIITTSYDAPEEDGVYQVTQYEYATLKYQVYPASTVDLILHDKSAGLIRIVNTLAIDTITKSWTYTFDTIGDYELYVNVHYGQDGENILSSTKYNVHVAKSDVSMDATAGSKIYFTAKNRSNDEADPAHWRDEISGSVEATLEGFLWNANSGWSNNGATTSLKVAGGARCTIPYAPFATDKRETGQTIEFDFSTSNLSDATATVISCHSATDNSGIEITATGAYFSSAEFGQTTDGDARIYVPFKENERIRLSFVITPMEADEQGHGVNDPEAIVNLWNGTSYTEMNSIANGWWRFVKVYINGICVGIHNYNDSFQQTNPAYITIGSDSATVDIYSIRSYDTVLYDRQIVNNFIADTQDPVEKLRLFKRNNILNEAGTDVEPSALRRLMPCLFVTCQTDATASGITNNEHILPTNKADKRGVTVFFDCDGLDDEAREYYNFCHTFVAFNVQWAVQGTSSQYYPRRNWKGTFKTEKKFKEDYVATATGSKPTYVFVDVPWEESIKDGRDARGVFANKYKNNYDNKYQLKDFSEEFTGIRDENRTIDEISSIPAKKFCMKADFAESSGTHNSGFAKYVDFILKSLGYDYLTPPQKAQYNKTRNMVDVTFRTSVDGYPIAMFWRPTFEDDWEFYGKFNFNIDKGAESVFGFIDVKDGGLTDSDINPMTGQPFVQFNEDYYDAAPQEDRIAYETPVECWEFTNNSTDLCKFRNITPTSFTEKSKDADGVTELPSWLGSFEARHPDNDNLIDLDYGTGLKKPTHWAAFSEWVSSTDRSGVHNYDKNLPVPTTWNGTYAELIAGASEKEVFATYEGRLTEMIADVETEFDYNRRYILQPVAIDPGDGTISPDMSYDLYGHIVHWNSAMSEWYDSEKPLNTWVDDGPYVEEESDVDYTKAYYIANQSDANFGKVYSYNSDNSAWEQIATISQYALEAPATYNMVTYQYDTAEYRFAKFKAELPLHMNIPMTTAYYVMTEFFCCADQRAKNMMFASWGYEPGSSNVKGPNAFANEAAADAAGYKPVYKYEIGEIEVDNVASSANPGVFAAPATRGDIILGAAPAIVCINEIDATNKKMEFYNPTASAITLTGYTLKGVDDKDAARADWSFPSGATIDAGGYYVITFKSAAEHPELGPAYGLSPTKKWSFTLEDGTGTTIDTVSKAADVDITNKSLGRETDGAETWVQFNVPTIGSANEPGEEPGVPTTELLSYVPYTTNATELSGLCFNADKSGLFGVSDTGKVYSIALDGTTVDLQIVEVDGEDLEGITIDSNGDLFAINERTGKVWKIAGPDYNSAVEAFTVTPVGDNPSSNGFEGITVFGNQFIVGNQKSPIALYTVSNAGGAPTLLATLDCVTEIADVEYDGTNIWVLDSTESTLAKLTAAGELVTKYSTAFIPNTENGPEALAINGNTAYIGCDNTNKDMFKVSLTNDPFDKTVVINECDPDAKRWELYNATNSDIDMTGYSMTKTDDKGEDVARRFVFGQVAATTIIPAHGFMVLQQNTDGVNGPNFGMSGTKGFDYRIYDASGNIIEHLDNLTNIVAIADGQTYGRRFDGDDEFILFKNHGSIGSSNANGIINDSKIYINEIDTTGTSIGKRFEIYNDSVTAVDITGYTFEKDGTAWTLTTERLATAVGEGLAVESTTLPGKGRLVIQTNNTKSNKATAESPAQDASKWPTFGISGTKGFVLSVRDASNNLLDRVNYFNDGVVNAAFVAIADNTTFGRYPDGSTNFCMFDTPTIGTANTEGTSLASILESYSVDDASSKIVINEISPSTDKIELYNTSDEAVALNKFGLVKNNDFNSSWAFPADASIAAHGFYVINLKQWNEEDGPTFGLSTKDGFELLLAETGTNYIVHDVVKNLATSPNFISLTGEYTMGRTPDGGETWDIYEVGSLGETNANGTVYVPEQLDPGTFITDHLVINEINGTSKMIEIYNPTSSAVTLGGKYGLLKVDNDAYGADDWYTFPSGAVIASHGYMTVCADKVKTGEDADYHTLFGISLNPGKVFDLYLISYTGSLDTTSKESILSGGTIVDRVDNMTNPVNYEEKDMGLSYGRVQDAGSNWTLFNVDSMSTTTGASTDTKLSNINGQAKKQSHTITGTIKTVLYWVPKDAEYIWYPIFYDNDTILSLDNTGHIKFNPNVESTDRVGTGYAYNGTESVLWLNFKDAYDAEIRSTYVNMRSKGGLTYANCMKYFNQGQSDQWPENVYNIDGKFKYVVPATKGYVDYSTQDPTTGKYGVTIRNSSYLYECQGSREEHRKWWLNNRFTYMDSRYFAVAYAEDYATIRLYTPSIWSGVTPSSTFKLTPYADMYLRVMFGQIVSTIRAEKNKTYDIIPSDPNLRFNDTETIIYGASNILSFGDMTNKYAGSVAIDKASKITDIILGADSPYYNENITGAGLTIGAGNTTLKHIDVRGCTRLTDIVGLNQVTSIESVDARRTGITAFNFSTAGANLNEIFYPNTIANIKLVNMKNITYPKINIPNYSNLRSVWIENCPQLRTTSWNIINNILNTAGNVLSAVRLVGFEWNITTLEAFATWSKLLKMKGYNASGIQSFDIPYLSGTVNIGGTVVVSTGYKSSVEALFAEAGGLRVNVAAGSTVGLNGVKITPEKDILDNEGTAIITPNKPFKFLASYLPDDFVLQSEKGVTWEVPGQLTVVERTSDYIILQYVGSTGGNNTYSLVAKSIVDPTLSTRISIRPAATLSKIKVTDTNNNEITSGDTISLNEGGTVLFNIQFLPEGTDDTGLTITTVNGAFIDCSYDESTQQLLVRGKDVDQTRNCSITLRSNTVSIVNTTINISVKNVVSRIFRLKNAAGDLISGYIRVNYTDKTGNPAEDTFYSETGVIPLRTDGSCGFSELTVKAYSNDAENGLIAYNSPDPIVVSELATTATSDVEREFTFYEPITATITIQNAGAPVVDRVLQIDSNENESIRNLVVPPYNRVKGGQYTSGAPVAMSLLANTTHNITITELDDQGNLVTGGGRYSQYIGKIKTTTADTAYTITISRDYLGNVNDDTELHMTVLSGTGVYNTLRLYVNSTERIVIDWGDQEDYNGSSDSTLWTTTIDGTTYPFNQENAVYHVYRVPDKEYDIKVTENTARIRWFHVIPSSASLMTPCFGTTSSTEGFSTTWSNVTSGGLVAYQSSGAAKFTKLPTFKFADKRYSKLLCVGNIYKNCFDTEDDTKYTNADSLLENTTVEQLSSVPLFERCVNIRSFKQTFKNSNITNLPANFFMGNTKATDFTETFMGCENLSTINSQENVPFLNPADDVELTSLLRTFKGCSNLSSEVPSLWKTFYGCSFVTKGGQVGVGIETFTGCDKIANIENVPGWWGGNINTTYKESEYKRLRYINFAGAARHTYYELSNIFPKGTWKYELDFTPTENGYGIQPLFGAATSQDALGDVLENSVDFSRGGTIDGSSPNIYSGYLLYRAGTSSSSIWQGATGRGTGTIAQPFTGKYGSAGNRVILDISYTTDGTATLYPYGSNKEQQMIQYNLDYWNQMSDFEATLPLKLMDIYITDNVVVYDDGELIHGHNMIFHEFKVYDENSELIHDIVPVYGQDRITGEMSAFLHDTITDAIYEIRNGSVNDLTYYKN